MTAVLPIAGYLLTAAALTLVAANLFRRTLLRLAVQLAFALSAATLHVLSGLPAGLRITLVAFDVAIAAGTGWSIRLHLRRARWDGRRRQAPFN